jgi:hypothetical protein
MQDPSLLLPLMAAFVGPESIPADTFEPQTRERLFGSR